MQGMWGRPPGAVGRRGASGMIFQLNILHGLLALAAIGCAYLALREVHRPYVSVWRLFVPPVLGCAVAFGLVLIQLAANHPPWQFGAALLVGLTAGAARGFTMQVQIDAYRPRFQARPATKRVLLWVSLVLVLCVALDAVGAVQCRPISHPCASSRRCSRPSAPAPWSVARPPSRRAFATRTGTELPARRATARVN